MYYKVFAKYVLQNYIYKTNKTSKPEARKVRKVEAIINCQLSIIN